MSLVMVGSEDYAFGALPRLKCHRGIVRDERQWLQSSFFLSSFLLSFPHFSVAPRFGDTESHSWAWPLELGLRTRML